MPQAGLPGIVALLIGVPVPELRIMVKRQERIVLATLIIADPRTLEVRQIMAGHRAQTGLPAIVDLLPAQGAEVRAPTDQVVPEVVRADRLLEDLPVDLHPAGQVLDAETN